MPADMCGWSCRMLHISPSTPNMLKTHITCTQTGNAKVKKMGQRADWEEKNSISILVLICKLDSFVLPFFFLKGNKKHHFLYVVH